MEDVDNDIETIRTEGTREFVDCVLRDRASETAPVDKEGVNRWRTNSI